MLLIIPLFVLKRSKTLKVLHQLEIEINIYNKILSLMCKTKATNNKRMLIPDIEIVITFMD